MSETKNEIDELISSIRERPLKYICWALVLGLTSSTTFWLWFYNDKIDDIQRSYDTQIKNLEFQINLSESNKSESSDDSKFKNITNGIIIIDPNSDVGKTIYNSIKNK